MIKIDVKVLDTVDIKIIEILSKNARISYTEMKKELDISDVAIAKRMEVLERKGYILGYTVILSNKAKMEMDYVKEYLLEDKEDEKDDEELTINAERFGFKKVN